MIHNNKQILIIGGYGSVGSVIARQLSERFSGQIVVAGRSLKKAERFALELNRKVIPLELDISTFSDYDSLFEGVGMVVMCLDQDSADIARHCLIHGIHYVDVSASYSVLNKIKALHETARERGATAVLSVGLAPGLTNLLAKHCHSKIPEMTAADIYVLLGLGEAHGEAAIHWTLENLNVIYPVLENGTTKQVQSFQDSKKTVFPDGIGRRTTYRFNFSDQHVLPCTLGLQSVSTRLCFDSAWFTSLLALMKKIKVSRILTIKSVERFVTGLLKRMHIGSDKFVIKVEGYDFQKNEITYECSLKGNGEGRVTGLVAAMIVEKLAGYSYPSGVFHIEQLFDLSEFLESQGYLGLAFEEMRSTSIQVTEADPGNYNEHWDYFKTANFRDPALSFLVTMKKAFLNKQ